jgi:hypothetical protein
VQKFSDGRRYSGQFDCNTFSGAAIMTWPDGHRYTGQYDRNQKNGEGYFLWPDKRFYDGQWKDGQRHGHGQYIAQESYIGEYYEGFRHGDGVLTWPDGKRYAGEFCRGAMHGSAVMTWPDGRQYYGQYVDSRKEGEGIFYWPDGRLYEGQWHNGLRHGASRYVDKHGKEHIGTWRKDRLITHAEAPEAGIKDPFCEAPVTLVSLRPKQRVGPFPTRLFDPVSADAPSNVRQMAPDRGGLRPDLGKGQPDAFRTNSKASNLSQSTQPISSGDVMLDMGERQEDDGFQEQEGQLYIDYCPDDVHVVKIDGAAHPVYDLRHLRAMPPVALRLHAESLYTTFSMAVGSTVPTADHNLLGWVYEVQSRHLKPILDVALRDAQGSDTQDFMLVSADTLQELEKPKPLPPIKKQQKASSVASTERLMDNDFENNEVIDLDNDLSPEQTGELEDEEIVQSNVQEVAPEPASNRKRQRLRDEPTNEVK